MTQASPNSLPLSSGPTMLLVLGPGRSGTSLVARLLECLGAKNSSNLMLANPGNPTGYFEDLDIYRFNEEVLLPHLGLKWYSLSSPDWSRLSASVREKLEQQALSIIEKNYLSFPSPLFILKEARINMLLPFWLSVLERAKIKIKIVGVLRDPVSVAQSLQRQHHFSITHGGMWYSATWMSALASTKTLPTTLVCFNDVFINPLKALQLIANQLELTLPHNVEEQVAIFTATHLDTNLRHFQASKGFLLDLNVPLFSVKVYEILLEASNRQDMESVKKTIPSLLSVFLLGGPLLKGFDAAFDQYYREFQPSLKNSLN